MLEGIQADGGFTFRSFGPSALQGVPSIGFGFLVARHDFDPSVMHVVSGNKIVGEFGYTSSTNFRAPLPASRGSSRHTRTMLRVRSRMTTRCVAVLCDRSHLATDRLLPIALCNEVLKRPF